jgi:hypothetical protein
MTKVFREAAIDRLTPIESKINNLKPDTTGT